MGKKVRRLEDVLAEINRRMTMTGKTAEEALNDMEPFTLHPSDADKVLRKGLEEKVKKKLRQAAGEGQGSNDPPMKLEGGGDG